MNEQPSKRCSKTRTWIGVTGFALTMFISFAIGESLGQRSMLAASQIGLNGVQAMLAFNRLQDEQELQLMLSKGCIAQARAVLGYNEDLNMQLIAGFVKGKLNPEDVKYMTDRDPKLLATLKSFKSKYGKRWEMPDCK